jgi:hypothetical protein
MHLHVLIRVLPRGLKSEDTVGNSPKQQETQDMTSVERLLVAALAQLDAVYEPIRDPQFPAWSSVWQLRWSCAAAGLPYRAGGSKEAERILTEAVAAGFVQRRRARSKTTGIQLTTDGLLTAWTLTGTSADAPLVATREVDRLAEYTEGAWVRETSFNHARGWGDGCSEELKAVFHWLLPALVAGWVKSNCDMLGRVGYQVTPEGREAMYTLAPAPDEDEVPIAPPEASPEVVQEYLSTYREATFWCDSLRPGSVGPRSEIGELPLSAAVWSGGPPHDAEVGP